MPFRQVHRYKSADDLAREAAGDEAVAGTRTGFVLDSGAWLVDDALTSAPDAYARTYDAGTSFVLDTGVGDGLPLLLNAGVPELTYP